MEVMDSPIDNPRDIMRLDTSSLPKWEKVEIGKLNLELT